MNTALNLEPPSFGDPVEVPFHKDEPPVYNMVVREPSIDDFLQPGADVFVELSGVYYHGKVWRGGVRADEVCVETPAAHHMSRHWKTLLFYKHSRQAVYGLAKLIIPGIDQEPSPDKIQTQYTRPKDEKGNPKEALLDEPQALARDEDVGEAWTEESTLKEEEQQKLWYQRD